MKKHIKNKDALKFFKKLSQKKSLNPNTIKLAKNSDYSLNDADFIMKYADSKSDILDLGSGTGLIINKIYKKINHITAIEPLKNFTRFIKKTKSISIVNEDIFSYKDKKKYDIVTLFAVVQYFSELEISKIYKKYRNNLKTNGKIIIKGQFGLKGDVVISGFSDELKTNYYSEYRSLKKEINILKLSGFKSLKTFNIYPPEYNRWNNTHFFAIVGERDD